MSDTHADLLSFLTSLLDTAVKPRYDGYKARLAAPCKAPTPCIRHTAA
jgi:hypothetical protein